VSDAPRVSRSLAIFDLDHGILKSSPASMLGPSYSTAERVANLAGPLLGPTVFRALSPNGGTSEDVRDAGRTAAATVELAPHARALLDNHRSERRRLVGATHAPVEAAEAIADAIGLDAVIGGPDIHGRGKLQALREWARDNGASLRRSYYYGGAFADAPIFAEVGHPVVVDPDPRLASLAWLKGWPTRSLHAPSGVARIAGRELQEWIRPLARPELVTNARFEFEDLENIPDEGPAIVCGNHRSYFDASAVGLAIAQRGRVARFLGKKEVFDAPLVGALARAAGGIRVERGTGSDEPLNAAAEALEAGELICLMPQGTIPRGPAFFETELKGRWGAARLAAMTKAPVIPLGVWGTEKVWPRSSRLPRLSPVGAPLVTIRAGTPVKLGYKDPDADTKAIMKAIVALLPEEAREPHDPSDEELRRTYPPGYKGDPGAESERRPGSDT
jgi:putative phosphoserine phosphatase/1-acylglycerol-3-phosphate O-acyltransferase